MSEVAQTLQHDSASLDSNTVEPSIFSANSVGEKLAASRQQKNWTVQYVAEQLKLSHGQINALEANQYNLLPQLVIVRGFVRAYAKLLKIDPDALVAMLPREAEPVQLETALRPALSTPFIDSRLSLQSQNEINRAYIWGAIGLALVASVFVVFQRTEFGQNMWAKMFAAKPPVTAEAAPPTLAPQESGDKVLAPSLPADDLKSESASSTAAAEVVNPVASAVPSSVATSGVNTAPGTTSVAGTKTVDNKLNDKSAVLIPAKIAEGTSVSKAVVATPAVVAPAQPTSTTQISKATVNSAVASNTAISPIAIAGGDKLVLKFRQDSWVQVKTETGAILSSHLAKAGSEEVFAVKQVLQVKIGNASGVDATLRGEALPVVAERDSKVANLVVK